MEASARDLKYRGTRPAAPFEPRVVNRAAREPRSRIRVVQFNAAGGKRFDEIVACLRRPPISDADIFLLCEINHVVIRGGRDVAGELAALMGMSFAYVAEFGMARGGNEISGYKGNAILSALPFENVEAIALPNPGTTHSRRRRKRPWSIVGSPTGLVTSVRLGGDAITVGLAHLHSRCAPLERARQMGVYMDEFPARGPAIFGGDLNTTTVALPDDLAILKVALASMMNPRRFKSPESHEPLFEIMRARGLLTDGANVPNRSTFTFSGLIPPRMRPKLDWLATRELEPIAGSAKVISPRRSIFSRRASDHDLVMVDVAI